eukprot:m.121144 g.121144  ORF g.121144 m.121144 type:complete len:139 (+) comp12920_c2_seq4:1472-1888(+)
MSHNIKDPSHKARWIVVYPAYIDATRSINKGRKIAKDVAVEKPDPRELIFASHANPNFPLTITLDGKAYPQDYLVKGRLRVQLKNSDGTLVDENFPNRKSVYLFLANAIKEKRELDAEEERKEEAGGKKGKKKKKGKK